MPGMPATGLGGIFYALLILWILLRESWRTVRGRSLPPSRRRVGVLVALLLLILLTFFLFGLAIQQLGPLLHEMVRDPALSRAYQALLPRLALVPFVILSLLMIGLQILRLVLARRHETAVAEIGEIKREAVDLPRVAEQAR